MNALATPSYAKLRGEQKLSTHWLTALQATSWQTWRSLGLPKVELGTVGSRPVPAFFDGRQLEVRKSEIHGESWSPFGPLGRCHICSNPTFACNKIPVEWSRCFFFWKKYHQIRKIWSCCQLHTPFFMPLIQYKCNEKPLLNKCALSCIRDLRKIFSTSSSLAQPSMDRSRPFFLPTPWDLNVFSSCAQQILLYRFQPRKQWWRNLSVLLPCHFLVICCCFSFGQAFYLSEMANFSRPTWLSLDPLILVPATERARLTASPEVVVCIGVVIGVGNVFVAGGVLAALVVVVVVVVVVVLFRKTNFNGTSSKVLNRNWCCHTTNDGKVPQLSCMKHMLKWKTSCILFH